MEAVYKSFSQLKKDNLVSYAKIVKQHQEDLILQKGVEYFIWRITRAVSLAHCFQIYDLLNVKMSLEDCRGETFYVGIPPVTEEELELGKKLLGVMFDFPETNLCWHERYGLILFSDEMVGNDGEYHKIDELS